MILPMEHPSSKPPIQPNMPPINAERIVEVLSEQQHLRPHQSIEQAAAIMEDSLGVCPGATKRAIELLRIDPIVAVGRLRRTELIQLGRTIHRIWRQNAMAAAGQPQPA
jgi:hypothetical protein